MPEGFKFPIREQFWMPLRLDPMKWRPWEGPEIELFGRLAPGVSSEQATGGADRRLDAKSRMRIRTSADACSRSSCRFHGRNRT